MHNYNFPSIQNQTFVCMFLRYKLFYFPKYSTSTEYIIGEYYIILILETECRLGHALYNHLQERVTVLFFYENYLGSRSFLLQIIVSLFWKKRNLSQKLRKVFNIETLRFMEIQECQKKKKKKKKKERKKEEKRGKKNIKHDTVVKQT